MRFRELYMLGNPMNYSSGGKNATQRGAGLKGMGEQPGAEPVRTPLTQAGKGRDCINAEKGALFLWLPCFSAG